MESLTLPVPGSEPAPKVPVVSESVPAVVENAAPDQANQPVESAEGQSEPESKSDQAAAKPKATVSERISTIVAQKKQAEAERTIALREVERLQSELARFNQSNIDQLPYEQQIAAQVQAAVKAERFSDAQAAAAAKAEEVQRQMVNEYRAKVDDARERMPDFDTAMTALQHVNFHDAAAQTVMESDKAAELTYWLGKNASEAQRISGLPPARQVAEIARLEAKLSQGPQPRRHSTAPPPPTTISGASSPAAKDPASMRMEEYAKWHKTRSKG